MEEIKVKADIANMPTVTAFVNERLEAVPVERKLVLKIGMVIDEILNNISNYGYEGEKGDVTVGVEISPDKSMVTLKFMDNGVPYDPLAKEDPDVTLTAEQRKIGGLGIFMVKKSMDAVEYEYIDGTNNLTMRKKI